MAASRKVLIVDDNIDAADMTAALLRLYGLQVDVAYSGLEGLAAAKAAAPNVIFLDIGMPEMDGYEVATALRADEAFRGVKIVALTAWGDAASREKSKAVGFDLHITKPANFDNLLDIAR